MNKSESIVELAKALSKFQAEVKQPKKDGINPHFRSNFVSLDNVIQTINDTAPKFGLSFLQFPLNEEDKVGVKTIIMHESGEFIEGEPVYVKPQKFDAQALGAVVTYLRRYSLSSIFGIASELDDDAESTMIRQQQQNRQQNYTKPISEKPAPPTIKPVSNLQEALAMKIPAPYTAQQGKTIAQVWTDDKEYLSKIVAHAAAPKPLVDAILMIQKYYADKQNTSKTGQ